MGFTADSLRRANVVVPAPADRPHAEGCGGTVWTPGSPPAAAFQAVSSGFCITPTAVSLTKIPQSSSLCPPSVPYSPQMPAFAGETVPGSELSESLPDGFPNLPCNAVFLTDIIKTPYFIESIGIFDVKKQIQKNQIRAKTG